MVNANTRINTKISLFGGYFYNHALSNVPTGLPANDYNLAAEYGRSNFDVRHHAFLAGSIATKWDIRLNPFVILSSGGPFDIVSPILAGNSSFVLRPAFAASGANLSDPNILVTQWGTFDLNPYLPNGTLKPGETIIPRNYGQSPGSVTVNLRLSKTFGFGPERNSARSGGGGDGGFHGGGGGPRGGGHGGMGGGMRMGGGPMGGMFGGGSASTRRYQLTLSVNAINILNHTNYGPVNGILGSPTFGTSTTLAGGFAAEASPLNNRRIQFQARFTF
jgi:hypothetical protein